MLRVSDLWVLSHKWKSYIRSLPTRRLGEHCERWDERKQELENKESCELLSSVMGMTITLTTWQQLWPPAQDQHKIKPISIQTRIRQRLMKLCCYHWECRLSMHPWRAPHSCVHRKTSTDLKREKRQARLKVLGNMLGVVLGRLKRSGG